MIVIYEFFVTEKKDVVNQRVGWFYARVLVLAKTTKISYSISV